MGDNVPRLASLPCKQTEDSSILSFSTMTNKPTKLVLIVLTFLLLLSSCSRKCYVTVVKVTLEEGMGSRYDMIETPFKPEFKLRNNTLTCKRASYKREDVAGVQIMLQKKYKKKNLEKVHQEEIKNLVGK